VQEGRLDSVRGRRRFHRPDGSTIEVESVGWAIRSRGGPDLAFWVTRDGTTPSAQVLTAWAPGPATLDLVGARVTLDDHWQLARVSTSTGLLLGRPAAELGATSIIELTHPDDQVALLSAFARATGDTAVGVRVRLRHHDRSWRTTHAAPTVMEGDGSSVFALDLAIDEEGAASGNELGRLAGHLRRIATQIESAGGLVETADPLGLPIMTELSPRQWEVVSRLVRGERVATIAAEMFLSQSTVRNHLSAIFRKVGVHSQQELLALWRGASRAL
jgi:DNA-binding CsgD family transcriptional regulator